MNALRIVDADGHIREEVDQIHDFLERPFNARKFFFPPWPGDGRYRGARISSTPPITKLPSEYFTAGNIYVGCEAGEKTLPFVAHWLGADHLVFPTDFPHSFTFERFVEEVRGFVERKDLPEELTRKILWDNPKRLYRI
jgi:predicted TIM-barrel fold metal-dependent hydrolase